MMARILACYLYVYPRYSDANFVPTQNDRLALSGCVAGGAPAAAQATASP